MSILKEREKTHGEFQFVAALTRSLKEATQVYRSEMPAVHEEALDMIFVKIARVICGDHNEPDHWRDIIGYAQLVLNSLTKNTASGATTTIMEMEPDEVIDPSIGDDWDFRPFKPPVPM